MEELLFSEQTEMISYWCGESPGIISQTNGVLSHSELLSMWKRILERLAA